MRIKRCRPDADKMHEARGKTMIQTASTGHSISCRECRYYLVTWDRSFPHGCRAHKFKSKKLPALEVFEASGLQCLLFAARPPRHPAESEPDCDTVAV
jgi:hypothetical protein